MNIKTRCQISDFVLRIVLLIVRLHCKITFQIFATIAYHVFIP